MVHARETCTQVMYLFQLFLLFVYSGNSDSTVFAKISRVFSHHHLCVCSCACVHLSGMCVCVCVCVCAHVCGMICEHVLSFIRFHCTTTAHLPCVKEAAGRLSAPWALQLSPVYHRF